MKKVTLLSAILFVHLFSVNAQTIQNSGLETWVNFGAYSDPDKWFSSNMFTFFGTAPSVTMTSDAHSGSTAARIQIAEMPDPTGGPSTYITGFLGNGDLMNSEGGSPFPYRPNEVAFWYKYFPINGDESVFNMLLTKWNPTTGDREIIGAADMGIFTASPSYTQLIAPVIYLSNNMPDSVQILVSVGTNSDPNPGTYLIADDFSFNFTTGINDAIQVSTSVFPNPANEIINFKLPVAMDVVIELFDLQGHLVRSEKAIERNHLMQVGELSKGIYVYRITDASKELRAQGKVSIN